MKIFFRKAQKMSKQYTRNFKNLSQHTKAVAFAFLNEKKIITSTGKNKL